MAEKKLTGISRAFGMVLGITLCPVAWGQKTPTPDEVLKGFRTLDAAGVRLTASGWYGSNHFFLRPDKPPKAPIFGVMFGESIYHTKVEGKTAEVWLLRGTVGQIDAVGHFTSVVEPELRRLRRAAPDDPLITGPTRVDFVYQLVLTDSYWEFGPNGEGLRQVKGVPQWKLEYFSPEPWVTVDVAIKYLATLREKLSSEIVKKNADESIAALRRAR